MRINTNIIALTACNSLSTASKRTSQSIEKLSSGYKINSVRDNPGRLSFVSQNEITA